MFILAIILAEAIWAFFTPEWYLGLVMLVMAFMWGDMLCSDRQRRRDIHEIIENIRRRPVG